MKTLLFVPSIHSYLPFLHLRSPMFKQSGAREVASEIWGALGKGDENKNEKKNTDREWERGVERSRIGERERKKEKAAGAGARRPHTRWRLGGKWPCVRQEEHLCLLRSTQKTGWGEWVVRGKDHGLQHEQGLTRHHRLNCTAQFEAFSTIRH